MINAGWAPSILLLGVCIGLLWSIAWFRYYKRKRLAQLLAEHQQRKAERESAVVMSTPSLSYNENDALILAEAFARWLVNDELAHFVIPKPHAFMIGALAQHSYVQGEGLPGMVRGKMCDIALAVQERACDTPELYNLFETGWRGKKPHG